MAAATVYGTSVGSLCLVFCFASFSGAQTPSNEINFDFDTPPPNATATPFDYTVSGLTATFSSPGDPGVFSSVGQPSIFFTLTGNTVFDPGPALKAFQALDV